MRTLKFVVDGQIIKPDSTCDFSGLVPGPNQLVRADFAFSKEWTNVAKVAAFYSKLGSEYPPQALNDGRTCVIPMEALKRRGFKIQILGKNGLITNKVEVVQEGGCV